jgi:hypothetical protein
MITCTIKYEIDPDQVQVFEDYAKAWIYLVTKLGGTHHGYWLPHEGASDIAYAMFSFSSLAEYEDYRARMAKDPECQATFACAQKTKCIRRYDRSFTRPVLDGQSPADLGML